MYRELDEWLYRKDMKKRCVMKESHFPGLEIFMENNIMENSPVENDAVEKNAVEEKKECCQRTKERSDKEYRDLIHRLNRIEGQVRGIRRMLEADAYCTDILVQVSAVNAALNSFNKVLLANHIRTCVADDIRAGKDETVDELVLTLQKLMK